jgi:hypothetical protein
MHSSNDNRARKVQYHRKEGELHLADSEAKTSEQKERGTRPELQVAQ